MKKIYLFVSTSLFLLLGGITACDDNSLNHDEVYIPDPWSFQTKMMVFHQNLQRNRLSESNLKASIR